MAATLLLSPLGWLHAQTFTTLHCFSQAVRDTDTNSLAYRAATNADGLNVVGPLVLSSNTLYGAARAGGASGRGTVFSLSIDGSGFTTLHSFSALDLSHEPGVNNDGAWPDGVMLSSNTLYGVTEVGGQIGAGTVFSISTDGTGFTDLWDFNLFDNNQPKGLYFSLGDTLFGASLEGGGTSANGELFSVNTDGSGFNIFYYFTGPQCGYGCTNADGTWPRDLITSDSVLYGTAQNGGPLGGGTVFSLNTDGTGFAVLHGFTLANSTPPYASRDGSSPSALVVSGTNLYGIAGSGPLGGGTIFTLNTDGTGFNNLHNLEPDGLHGTNSGGMGPTSLIVSGNNVFGTTLRDGAFGGGTVFAMNTDGTGFITLHNFLPNTDGAGPNGLVLSGNTLYGSTSQGGGEGNGTIFSISFTPQLKISLAGASLILTWPTNYAGFDYSGYTLQSATDLGPSAVWATNLPPPVVVNGLNTVTNQVTGRQQFFRLRR